MHPHGKLHQGWCEPDCMQQVAGQNIRSQAGPPDRREAGGVPNAAAHPIRITPPCQSLASCFSRSFAGKRHRLFVLLAPGSATTATAHLHPPSRGSLVSPAMPAITAKLQRTPDYTHNTAGEGSQIIFQVIVTMALALALVLKLCSSLLLGADRGGNGLIQHLIQVVHLLCSRNGHA